MSGDRVVLYIGRFDSHCGACGKGCWPHEPTHKMNTGYDQHGGCGAKYTHVQSLYVGRESENAVREMRPDLTFLELGGPEGLGAS